MPFIFQKAVDKRIAAVYNDRMLKLNEITSRENPHIKAAVRLRSSAAQRGVQQAFFLEGSRLCGDALLSGYVPQVLFVTAAAREKYGTAALEQAAQQAFEVTQSVAQKLGDTQHPQGIFGIFARKAGCEKAFWQSGGRYAALENVQDPGNLGAVARTAQALGFSGMLCGGGCDVFHPKALRASMGALLRLPVLQSEDFCGQLQASGLPCFAAVPDPSAVPVQHCDFSGGGVLVIGSEGSGLSEQAMAACGQRVTIPMPGQAESLNAAASAIILMWEMIR